MYRFDAKRRIHRDLHTAFDEKKKKFSPGTMGFASHLVIPRYLTQNVTICFRFTLHFYLKSISLLSRKSSLLCLLSWTVKGVAKLLICHLSISNLFCFSEPSTGANLWCRKNVNRFSIRVY